jgi:hypothetical protein
VVIHAIDGPLNDDSEPWEKSPRTEKEGEAALAKEGGESEKLHNIQRVKNEQPSKQTEYEYVLVD